jgi:hypothetical protein
LEQAVQAKFLVAEIMAVIVYFHLSLRMVVDLGLPDIILEALVVQVVVVAA